MLEKDFVSMAQLVPEKIPVISSSMLWYESFLCVGLFGEVLGRGSALYLSSFISMYIVDKREVPTKSALFLLSWVCPLTVL